MGTFRTADEHASPLHRPVRVPIGKDEVFARARELCEDLGWKLLQVDEKARVLRCSSASLLGGRATIEVRVEGPDGLPSSATSVESQSSGGLLRRDKRLVEEFVRKFQMRMC